MSKLNRLLSSIGLSAALLSAGAASPPTSPAQAQPSPIQFTPNGLKPTKQKLALA